MYSLTHASIVPRAYSIHALVTATRRTATTTTRAMRWSASGRTSVAASSWTASQVILVAAVVVTASSRTASQVHVSRSHAHVPMLSGCPRVTGDADREYFLGLLNDKLTHTFGTPLKHLFKEGAVHPYGDFLREVRHVEIPFHRPSATAGLHAPPHTRCRRVRSRRTRSSLTLRS